jgi:hypothetical protein
MFGSDQRGDLSGVPLDLQPGRAKPPAVAQDVKQGARTAPDPQSQLRGPLSPFRGLLRLAIWVSIGIGVIFALALVKQVLAGFEAGGEPDALESPTASATPSAPDQNAIAAENTYEDAMRDAAAASEMAERQHAEAMKAVEAARALAKNPDSLEAQEALKQAMQRVQAMSEQANR